MAPPREPNHSQHVAGSFKALASGEILSRLVALAALVHLTRTLGPVKMGMIGFAAAICTFMRPAVQAGFRHVGTKAVAESPGQASRIAASGTLVRLIVAALAFSLIFVVASGLPATGPVIVVTALSLFSLALDPTWVFKGLERNRQVGWALVVKQSIYVVLVYTLVSEPTDFIIVPACLFAADLTVSSYLLRSLLRGAKPNLSLNLGWGLLKDSVPVVGTGLFRHTIMTADVILIGIFLTGEAGNRAMGLYTVPYSIVFMALAVSSALHDSYRPAIVRAFREGKESLHAACRGSLAASAAVGAPIVVGGAMVAGPLIGFVMGAEYVDGAAPFRVILASAGLLFLGGVMHNLFLASGQLAAETRIHGLAALLNVGLNLFLIPRHGLMGAAWATLSAEACGLLGAGVVLKRAGILVGMSAVFRPLLAALMMGAVVGFVGAERSLALTVPVGVIAYGLGLMALRSVPEDLKGTKGPPPKVLG